MHQRCASSNKNGNAGRLYYRCGGCDHWHWLTPAIGGGEPSGSQGVPGSSSGDNNLGFYAVTDPETRSRLQALVTVPPCVKLGVGRDYVASLGPRDYDYLEVVHAWRVLNQDMEQGVAFAPR